MSMLFPRRLGADRRQPRLRRTECQQRTGARVPVQEVGAAPPATNRWCSTETDVDRAPSPGLAPVAVSVYAAVAGAAGDTTLIAYSAVE
jgi:hypothetical protein